MSTNEIKTVQTRRQAERALLGAVLLQPELLDDATFPPLAPEDFGAAGHRAIWRSIHGLLGRAGAITPAEVVAEMEATGADDLSELAGLATAPDLPSALAALVLDADPDAAIEHATAVAAMAANLRLVEQLEELGNQAKAWPPETRSVFCDAFEALTALFCGTESSGAAWP